MSTEQVAIVKLVYNRFMESEEPPANTERSLWSDMDNNLIFFDLLSDDEMVKESIIKYQQHCSCSIFTCEQEHDQEFCFAPFILECVGYILELYDETKELHPKNRYVLSYYLTMSELKIIYGQ